MGGGAAAGDQRSLGQKAAGPGEEGRGRRDRASGAGASVEPALAGKPAHPNAEAGAGEVPDFGPTLACEYLAKDHQVEVSKETLRQWLIGAGLRRVKRRKAEEVHVWRPRRSCRGELVQWDTSEHDWLEGRGPRLYLVAMIDDATSQAYARFVGHDSTEENLRVLWEYLKGWGRPVECYTDKSSLFTVNAPAPEAADEAVEEELTQIGRAF